MIHNQTKPTERKELAIVLVFFTVVLSSLRLVLYTLDFQKQNLVKIVMVASLIPFSILYLAGLYCEKKILMLPFMFQNVLISIFLFFQSFITNFNKDDTEKTLIGLYGLGQLSNFVVHLILFI